MCILCVVSRWSRRIVTMLPWLVIPFIITWAFSQLLPPGYRLEVTSTRLACLGVLLSSLGWYELLMPWLSSWRARRSALLRERRLIEAQEAAKWRKEATRRCRNCLTAYKIQTPGCGRFMCTYCGHASKRPVLEVPVPLSHTGSQGLQRASHAVEHSGPVVNGAGFGSFRGSSIRHDNGCWSRSSERRGCLFGDGTCGIEKCKAWQSFMQVLSYVGDLFFFVGKLWRKITGGEKAYIESSRNAQKLKDDLTSTRESRSEKARKKASEKRQARLEKALLEAEEKKQREDVARLVEERRRQREEKLRIEQESEKEAAAERDRELRRARELERRRKDKAKEKTGDEMEAKYSQEVRAGDNITKSEGQGHTVTPVKSAESLRNSSVLRGFSRDQGTRFKGASDNFARSDFSKYVGTVKRRLVPNFKMGSVFQNNSSWSNKTDGSCHGSKSVNLEPSVSPSSSNVVPRANIGWRKAPWFNARSKESDSLKEEGGFKAHSTFHGERLDLNVNEGPNAFNNKAVGAKQPPSAVGIAISQPPSQPPIAPPSTQTASLHQLFSIPTIFPPLDLPVDFPHHHEQTSQEEMKTSFVPDHTFFETPACVTLQSCKSIAGLSVPFSPATTEVNYNSVSPLSLSLSDSISSEGVEEQAWNTLQLHHMKVDDSFDSTPYKELMKSETLQLPHLSTVQALFDSEILLPESLPISPQKEGNFFLNGNDIACAAQVFDRKNLWSDISALNTAVQIWDEADNSQKVPPEFVDCITQEIMRDPVITADGHSYERTAIEKWLKDHDTSPKTGEVLPPPPGGVGVDKTLRPNHILRGQIIEYKEKLAKMQPSAVSWGNISKDSDLLTTLSTLGVLSF